ncbi:MAG: M20/M25/M40 family metallo-hydrolase, partial [Acidobacteriota bacterium]
MKPSTHFRLLLLTLLGVSAIGILAFRAPSPLPESTAPERFSALRAERHLQALASQPRVMGTAEHAASWQYLAAEIETLNLEPEIQQTTLARSVGAGVVYAAHITNVMARLPGRQRGSAVMLVGHYDTVPGSPGAGDNAAGVVALLETMRALRQGPQLANDVIFLFTDAEESGLLGAQA